MSKEKRGTSYADAGVNLEAGADAVERYKSSVATTAIPGVLGGIGGFGGLFSLRDAAVNLNDPVLVSATDGVGTKLRLAFDLGVHDTIGQDCVAMCVNDVVATGARPLFFLDYLATGRLDPEQASAVVRGIAAACKESGCALLGGETAEMPGFYSDGEYDVAGFCVGVAERDELFSPETVVEGDVLVGLRSSGFHSNGYSLIRRIVDDNDIDLSASFGAKTWGEHLLEPTRLYPKAIDAVRGLGVKSAAHITGGGFYENLPRALPGHLGAEVDEHWPIPSFMNELCKIGHVASRECWSVFNMGIGIVLVVAADVVDDVMHRLREVGEEPVRVGRVGDSPGVRIAGID